MFNRICLLASLVFVLAGCDLLTGFTVTENSASSDPIGEIGTVITVTGDIIGSVDDCIVDGICATIIRADNGTVYEVVWSEGMLRCEGQWEDIPEGARLEARGEIISDTQLTICRDSSYYMRQA